MYTKVLLLADYTCTGEGGVIVYDYARVYKSIIRFDEVCSLEGQEVPSLHAAVDISAR